MRVLLDECLPKRLAKALPPHFARRTQDMGWAGIRNGRLLALAAPSFDVFVTVDRKLEFQQNLQKLPIAVVVLLARSNRLADVLPLVPQLLLTLERLEPRRLVRVGPVG